MAYGAHHFLKVNWRLSFLFLGFHFLLSTTGLMAQSNYKTLMEAERYEQALSAALEEIKGNPDDTLSLHYAELLYSIGYLYSNHLWENKKALPYYKKALDIFDQLADTDLHLLALCHNNYALALDIESFFHEAIFHYEQALEIWRGNFFDDYKLVSTGYNNNLGAMDFYGDVKKQHQYLLDYQEYLDFISENMELPKLDFWELKTKLEFFKISYYANVKDHYSCMQAWNQALANRSAMPLQLREDLNGYYLSRLETIAYMYKDIGEYAQAIAYLDQMQDFDPNSFYVMKMQAIKAVTYADAQDWKKVLTEAEAALNYFETESFGASALVIKTIKAEALYNVGQDEEALQLVADIFSTWTEEEQSIAQLAALSIQALQWKNSLNHINMLVRLGNILYAYAEKSKENTYRHTALHLFHLAAQTFELYYLKEAYNPSLAQAQKKITEGILKSLQHAEMANHPKTRLLLEIIEKNNAQQFLKELISKNQQYLSLPLDLLQTRNELLFALQYDSDQHNTQSNRQQLQAIEQSLSEAAHTLVLDSYVKTFNLSEIQASLLSDEVLLKYYSASQHIYGLKVSHDHIELRMIGETAAMDHKIQAFQSQLKNPKLGYQEIAQELHEAFLAPFVIQEGASLCIIAEDKLASIPFEVLMDNKGKLVLEKNPITYLYSMRLKALKMPLVSTSAPDFFVGYAPDYNLKSYSSIKNNSKEVRHIAHHLGGQAYFGAEASKANFVKNIAQYRIHHLALHAVQDELNYENSALIFADAEPMYFHELYTYHIPADLVVLSACNSGIGSLEPGEGLMGLSRALIYAGTKSTVHSLWSVSDKETEVLMRNFYLELRQGTAKDEALRRAKLKFKQDNPLKTHPFFWAGFVVNGNVDPMVSAPQQSRTSIVLLLALLLLSLSYFGFRKRCSRFKQW